MAPSARASPVSSRRAGLHTPGNNSALSSAMDSPVFRFHDIDDRVTFRGTTSDHYRYDTWARSSSDGPWTADEHERFLLALEKFGGGQSSSSAAAAWHAIASAVATRSVADVQHHAGRYYAQLQAVNVERRKEFLAMQQLDARWTRHEDAQLERALAAHIPERASFPWDSIARRVPGKTPRDARERFHKLCYDVARIEAGQHVMMHLTRHAPRREDRDEERDERDHAVAIDCVVAPTPAETELLLAALEQVPVPNAASPDVLAAVASGVAALACSKHRQPPRRAVPQFSMDDARVVLARAIEAELSDPVAVVELLVRELRLRPHTSTTAVINTTRRLEMAHAPPSFAMSGHPATEIPSSSSSETVSHSSQWHQPSFTGDDGLDRDDTRAGEALLTHLKTSPVHNPQRLSHARRRAYTGNEPSAVFPLPSHAASLFPYSLMPSTNATTTVPHYNIGESDRRDRLYDHHDDDPMDDFL